MPRQPNLIFKRQLHNRNRLNPESSASDSSDDGSECYFDTETNCTVAALRQFEELEAKMRKYKDLSTQQETLKLTCPLCLDLIHKSVTTICSHTYCEACLDEYLNIKPVRNEQKTHRIIPLYRIASFVRLMDSQIYC